MRARVLIRVAVAAIVFGATAMVSVATAPVAPAVPPTTDVCTAAGGTPGTTANPGELTCTFSSPGDYVLALGTVTSALSLDVLGAAGGGVTSIYPDQPPEPGGNGAEARATVAAGGLNVLQIGIGSAGASGTSNPPGGPGTPGGGAGGEPHRTVFCPGVTNCVAGGGGGLSEVASGDVALVIAGAGGGAGLGARLTPGGNAGSAGPDGFVQNSDTPAGGGGAASGSSPGAGGTAGSCATVAVTGDAGTAGSGTHGGAGGSAPSFPHQDPYFSAAGGGGGAGYAGGGGGGPGAPGSSQESGVPGCPDWSDDGAGGGGGGSSFVTPDATSSSILDGASAPSTGNGAVTVTYTPLAAPVFNGCTPTPPNRAGFVACTYLTPGTYSAAIPADAVDVTETVLGAPGGGPGGGRGALATGEFGTALAGQTLAVAVGGAGSDAGQQATTVSVGSETVDVSQGWTLNVASSVHFGSGPISIGGQPYTVASVTGPTSIAIAGPQFVEPSEFVYIPSGIVVSQVAPVCTVAVAGGYPNGGSPGCGAAGGGGRTRVSGGVPVGMIAGGGGGSGQEGPLSTPGPGGNAGSAGTASGSVPGGAGGGGGGGAGTSSTPGGGGAGGSCGPGVSGAAGSGSGAGGAGGAGPASKGGGGGGGGAGFAGGGGGGQGGGTSGCAPAGGGGGGGASSFLPAAAIGSAILDGADAPITGLPNGAAFITYALAPEVTGFTGPTTVQKAQFSATFGRSVMGVTTSTFTIVEVGGNNIAGVVSCRNESSGPVSCATGPATTATFTTTSPLIAGEYYFVNINPNTSPPGVAGYPDGELAPPAQGYERAPTAASAFQYPVKYQWGTVKKAKALGGSYVQEQFPGATLTFTTTSTSIGLVMWDGPDGGTAFVSVKTKGSPTVFQSIDTYASKANDATTTISGLNTATHTVTISVDGASNPSSTSSIVRLDGTVLDGVTDPTPATTSMWPNYPGDYAYTGTKGATVSFRFRGTGVSWTALTGPNDGQAQVTMDGNRVTEDLYAPGYGDTTFTYNTYDGFHTIVVKTLHTKNAASSDYIVTVKGFNAL
jgi:hypothetical protein